MEQFDNDSTKPQNSDETNTHAAATAAFPHARYAYVTVILIFLGYQFAGEALVSLFARNGSGLLRALMQGFGQALFMLIPAIIITQYSPLRTQGLMRFGGQVSAAQWIIGLAGVVAVHVFAIGFAGVQESLIPERFYPLYKRAELSIERVYAGLLGGSTAWDAARAFVIGAVIPAFSEEILFRGVMQRSLEAVRTPQRAIVLTALIFAILHWNPILLVPLVVIGVYLGFLAYHTQSLALPIVAHFVNNALAILTLYTPDAVLERVPAMPDWLWLIVGGMGIVVATTLLLRTPASASGSASAGTQVAASEPTIADNADSGEEE
jgi:uncharacterized protein